MSSAGGTIAATRPRRQRRVNRLINNSDDDFEGRRSGSSRQHGDDEHGGARRLRLKVGQGGGGASHIGPADTVGWDRELDSDPDEPLAVEEHFVLRVPPEVAPRLKDLADKRDLPPDVWFKFKDSRRAVFHLGNKLYGAKLVDLPALLESQRLTGVGGQTVKVADVSQMLLVEEEIQEEAQVTGGRTLNIEDFVYPHGITPPLKHVRKRRFRRRINRRTIEQVETAVEKLLEADAKAEKVQFEMLDYDVPSDDEEYDPTRDSTAFGGSVGAPTPRPDGAASSPAPFGDEGESARGDNDDDGDRDRDDDDDDEDEEGGSGYDSDLANEINKGLEAMDKSDEDDSDDEDGDGLFGGSSDDDDDDDDDQAQEPAVDPQEAEARKRIKLLAEEMGDLDKAIASKETELAKAANPIFKKRFEEMIKKLTVDRDSKRAQHTAAVRELDKKREDAAAAATAEATNPPPIASVVLPVAGSSGGIAGAGQSGNGMDLS